MLWGQYLKLASKVFMRLVQGGVTVCGCGCQAGKVGARDRQKMAYYCPRGRGAKLGKFQMWP